MTRKLLPLLILLTVLSGACNTFRRTPKATANPELLNLAKEDIFAKGEAAFNEKKYARSRTYFGHVYENYPNDPLGRRSLLRVADSYFFQGNSVNLVEAQYKYRDFINRYPSSDFADYAMFQIANVSYKQMEKPDRDQSKTRETVQKLNEMLVAYPRSSYKPDAELKLQKALDRLALHEHNVARFYIKRGEWDAAISRLNGIVDRYPNYERKAATFYDLASALESAGRKGEARLYYERVMTEFPDSDFASKAKSRVNAGSKA